MLRVPSREPTLPSQHTSQRGLLADPDLLTPAHDSIMLWVDANLDSVVRELVPNEHFGINLTAAGHLPIPAHLQDCIPDPVLRVGRPTWEQPILRGGQYVIGFVDMKVVVERSRPFVDDGEWRVGFQRETVFIEAKSSIRSLGEVIRQVRLYQEYAEGTYAIASPDTRFRSVLESQGIGFIPVPIGSLSPVTDQMSFDL